jgi:integrase
LRRDPHMLGWFRWLCERNPPLANITREGNLLRLRRLFRDLAGNGHPPSLSALILSGDFPRKPLYLPKPLSPEDDRSLQRELRRTDNLHSNALLLMRATGIRLGECINLGLDCLRLLAHDQWALHVPLGKLYTERLVPVDKSGCRLIARILALRAHPRDRRFAPAKSPRWLLPRATGSAGGCWSLRGALRTALIQASKRAGLSRPATPHQLRHTFATEMLRLRVSLPALMQLMGHKDVRMTLRYVQVTQQDLQREFHLAHQNRQRHLVPKLPAPASCFSASADLPSIRQSLAATRHLLEMYRRQLGNENTRHKLQRLDKRLLTVAFELERLAQPEK